MLATGYFKVREDGTKRLIRSDFYLALMEARSAKEKADRKSTQPTVETPIPDKDQKTADQLSETANIKVYGTGIMICLYELTKKDFTKLKKRSDSGELDYDELEVGMDYGDQVAAFFEPSIIVDGEELNDKKTLAELGFTVHCADERIAPKGSYWSFSIERYKGIWGSISAPPENAKDPSNYVVYKSRLFIGEDPSFDPLEIATVSFMDGEYGDLNEHDLEGKSIDWYLVDMSGEVLSV
jgi:hypothetical protein